MAVIGAFVLPAIVPPGSLPEWTPSRSIAARASWEVWTDGFADLRGVAVDDGDRVYVTDHDSGTIARVGRLDSETLVTPGLERPVGLLAAPDGTLLVADERAGRVVRVRRDGSATAVAVGLRRPRWLALDVATDVVYVSTRRLEPDTGDGPGEAAEPELILALAPDAPPRVVLDSLRHVQGLVVAGGVLYAATGGMRHDPGSEDGVVAVAIGGERGPEAPVALGAGARLRKPIGLARDRLGALFVTAEDADHARAHAKRVIVKVHADGATTRFAEGLDDPQGLAFAAAGDLYAADGRAGRVLRFRAPEPPRLDPVPRATNQPSVVVGGLAEPAARIVVLASDGAPLTAAPAAADGRFQVPVPLAANTLNVLQVLAVGHGGEGLASRPAEVSVLHDDVAPALAFLSPPESGFARGIVDVRVSAHDEGAHVAAVTVEAGGARLDLEASAPLPASAVTASARWDTRVAGDGAQALAAVAVDGAGNSVSVGRTVLVDNTPPDATIVSAPEALIEGDTGRIVFTASDNLTPVTALAFAWRLDGGPWSPFGPATSITLAGLAAGDHRVEVTARDLAGNEDPTPAARVVSVRPRGLGVSIREPSPGATVPAGLLLVRGVVTSDDEAGVTVNGVAASVADGAFTALVPVDAATAGLVALATSVRGAVASHAIDLSVVPGPEPTVGLHAVPASGLAPLTVRFAIRAPADAMSFELDADGDGVVDAAGSPLDAPVFTFTRPAIYAAAITVTDAAGVRQVARALVHVFDRASLDAQLRARWTAMRDALRAGDVGAALGFIVERVRGDYGSAFRALAPRLADIDQILTPIVLMDVRNAAAIYEMTRIDGGVEKSFEVRFAIDWDGLWRIEAF